MRYSQSDTIRVASVPSLDVIRQHPGYRPLPIIGLLLTGAIALIYFAVWEWNSAHPLLELRFLRRRNFLVGGLGL